jgi:hypothetical protein
MNILVINQDFNQKCLSAAVRKLRHVSTRVEGSLCLIPQK